MNDKIENTAAEDQEPPMAFGEEIADRDPLFNGEEKVPVEMTRDLADKLGTYVAKRCIEASHQLSRPVMFQLHVVVCSPIPESKREDGMFEEFGIRTHTVDSLEPHLRVQLAEQALEQAQGALAAEEAGES